ncbi:chlamydial GcvH-like protein upstream region protein [Candidatus Rubidus massiliensis]|nr:chlamydial GcvH-like protein upstream region protein [Candidatus Rubidus massiliensis]
MLNFFRKYQRGFFIVVTVVTVISFSFFGTSSTLNTNYANDQVVFKAIDGSSIKRSEIEQMANFINTDVDGIQQQGIWSSNFLNDGVLKKDILKTGIAEVLASEFNPLITSELTDKLEKERKYKPYSHPEASFISVENSWSYFAPKIRDYFYRLKEIQSPLENDAFATRVNLFLESQNISPLMLQRVLQFQEQNYSWVNPDQNIPYTDMSLFGYHNFEDWFGVKFTRLASAFIINAAKVAEQKGYKVSQNEALADLMQQATTSFNQNINNPYLGVANASDYFNEQLRRLGMTQTQAVKLWQQVLLFRRLFQDIGNSVVLDPISLNGLHEYASLMVEGELYALPPSLQLANFSALQNFETYLKATAKNYDPSKSLMLPTEFHSIDYLSKNYPELVRKRYLVEISKIAKPQFNARVGIKEMWNWEVSDENWKKLQENFPVLSAKAASSREERFKVLDELDEMTRRRVDLFAKNQIVDQHPEWIEKALIEAQPKETIVALYAKGNNSYFDGLKNSDELMKLLDNAPLNIYAKELESYTPDQKNYYRIKVLDRDKDWQVATFIDADKEGILTSMVDNELQKLYKKSPNKWQKEDKTAKTFQEAKNEIADEYFSGVISSIKDSYAKINPSEVLPPTFLGDYAASLRLYPYMHHAMEEIKSNPQIEYLYVTQDNEENKNALLQPQSLADQWKLTKTSANYSREDINPKKANLENALALDDGQWTSVYHPVNGDLYFFNVKKKSMQENSKNKEIAWNEAQQALVQESQRNYTKHFLQNIKEKNAIVLDYLNHNSDDNNSKGSD